VRLAAKLYLLKQLRMCNALLPYPHIHVLYGKVVTIPGVKWP